MKWALWIALMVCDGVLAKGYQEQLVEKVEYEHPVSPLLREAVLEEFEALKDDGGQMVLDDDQVTEDQKQTVLDVLPYIVSDQWRLEGVRTPGARTPGQPY